MPVKEGLLRSCATLYDVSHELICEFEVEGIDLKDAEAASIRS